MLRMTWATLAAAIAAVPALAAVPAHPGMLNYIEGQASINEEKLGPQSVAMPRWSPDRRSRPGTGKPRSC
jgi:hypothetical protein